MKFPEFLQVIRENKKNGLGLMSEVQYSTIGLILTTIKPCNLLVFGLGGDSIAWERLNKGGKTVFLEDDASWINQFEQLNLDIVKVDYNTKAENYESLCFDASKLKMNLPERITDAKWDFIIVDGPLGHGPPGRSFKGPGRMQSIYTAYTLLRPNGICIVDDFSRDIEKKYAFHYFGKENLINIVENKVAFFKKDECEFTNMNSFSDYIEGKTVALVGPATYMMNSNLGKVIDNHDIVVRINRGIESIEHYSQDIGKRTDVYYSCLIERAQQTGKINPSELKDKYGIKYVVAPPDSDFKGYARSTCFHHMVDQNKARKIHELIPIRVVDHQFHNKLAANVNCKPNTGFMAIYDLLRLNVKKLSIYGFSFYLDGFIRGQKTGVENEKNCTEQEFADMAYNSKRHIQQNMWKFAKETLLNNEKVNLDKTLKQILELKKLDRKLFKEKIE